MATESDTAARLGVNSKEADRDVFEEVAVGKDLPAKPLQTQGVSAKSAAGGNSN